MTDFQLTQLAVGLGTLTTILVGLYRDSRDRRWDLEDRRNRMDEAAIALKQASKVLTEKVEASTQQVKDEAEHTRQVVAVNTELTAQTKAAAEQTRDVLNDVNGKLEGLQQDVTNGRAGGQPKEKP